MVKLKKVNSVSRMRIGENRNSLIKKNIYVSFGLKGWSAIITLLMVPLTLKMLGAYNNGIWLTISGFLMWIDMLDIGLGNGLRNAVAENIANNNYLKVREAVSSTFFMLTIISLTTLAVISIVIILFDMYDVLGIDILIQPELNLSLFVAALFVCSTFIFKSIGNFYMGMQLPAVNYLFVTTGQTMALVLTAVAYYMGARSLLTVVTINTLAPFLTWLLSYPYTFRIKYPHLRPAWKYVNKKTSMALCNTSIVFFIIQICSVMLFMTSNIIISKMFSPAEVTPYQIAYRYFSLMMVLFTIICMPFWNATTDAYSRGDLEWIRKASRKLNFLMVFIASAFVMMILMSDWVYKIWVGPEIHIPFSLSVSVATFLFILILSMRYSYFLNGVGALRIQLIMIVIATIIYFPLAWIACKIFQNVTALVLTMCFVNIPGLFANIWKFNKIINSQ